MLSVTVTNSQEHSPLLQLSRVRTVAALRFVSSSFLMRNLNELDFGCNPDHTVLEFEQEHDVVLQDANVVCPLIPHRIGSIRSPGDVLLCRVV